MTGQNNYTCRTKAVERLEKEYEEHGNLIIAFDFDNTIYDYHNAGLDMECTISALKKAYELGLELFCFTANKDHELVSSVVEKTLGIPVSKQRINSSSLDHLFVGRKPFYSLLLDDRAGLDSSLRTLNQLIFFIMSLQEANKSV